MSAVLKPAMRRAWPRPDITAAIYHDFVRDEHAVDGVRQALDQIWTFERDSIVNGWERENRANLLTSFAVDEPAFVIDPATGQRLGYRALAGFTNSLLWNRDLSNGVWSVNETTNTQDQTGADGASNAAWTVEDDDGSVHEELRQEITVSDDSNTHTLSVYIKKDSDETRFPEIRATLRGGTTDLFHHVQINTATGVINNRIDDSGDGASSYDAGDWWQLVIPITNNGTGNTTYRVRIFPAFASTLGGSDVSATGSIVYDFGGVYLNSSIAGPPIETEGSPVSTAADDATESIPTSLQSAGTLVVSARTANGLSGDQVLAQMDDGTENNRVRLVRNASREVRYIVTDGGTEVANMNLGTVADDTDTKVAIRYGDDDYAGIISGGTLQTDTAGTMPSISTLRYGRDTADGEEWNGTIADVRGDDAYTDSQLEGAV